MKKKQVLKLLCFSLCILTVLLSLSTVFHYERAGGQMRKAVLTYAELEKNTVDVAFIGTSGFHCTYIPGQAYQNFGLTSYDLTIDGLRVWHVLPMVEYACKYQTPKVVVVDMRPFLSGEENDVNEIRSRYFNETFSMFSPFRFKGVARTLKYVSKINDESPLDLTYYFNVIRYHDMWQDDLNFDVLEKSYAYWFGFRITKGEFAVRTLPESVFTTEKEDISWFQKECFEELVSYAKEKGITLLFVNSPRYVDEGTAKRMNTFHELLDENGIPYIDFCTEAGEKQYVFDKATKFRDKSHTNYWGAKDFTDIMAEYLMSNYDINDRRLDNSGDYFAEAYEQTMQKVDSMLKKYK